MGYLVNALEEVPDIVLRDEKGEAVPWHWVVEFVENLALRVGDQVMLELYDDDVILDEDGAVVDGEVIARAQIVTALPPGLFIVEIGLPGMDTFERVKPVEASDQLVEYDIGRRGGLPLIAPKGALLSSATLLNVLTWIFLEGCLPPGMSSHFPSDYTRDQMAGIRAPDKPEDPE